MRRRLGQVGRVLVQHEEVGRAVLQRASRGGDQLADQLVPRRVGRHVVANPIVVRPHRRRLEPLAVDQQQVGPLVGPVVDELRPREQLRRSAGRACRATCRPGTAAFRRPSAACRSCRGYARRRNSPSPAGGDGGRFKLSQLGQHQLVDEVPPRRLGEHLRRDRVGIRRADRGGHDLADVPGGDGPFAVPHDAHQAVVVDLGHREVRGRVLGPAGDVFDVAVA